MPEPASLQVNFRMPADLKDRLQRSADDAGRSLTAEIVVRLEQSFAQPGDSAALTAAVRDMADERRWYWMLLGRAIEGTLTRDTIKLLHPLIGFTERDAAEQPRDRRQIEAEYEALSAKLKQLMNEPGVNASTTREGHEALLAMLARLTFAAQELLNAERPE